MTALPGRPPVSEVRDIVAAAWSEVLERSEIGADDDFFALGGNSLHAVRIIARASDDLGVDLSVRAVLETRTIRGMVARVIDAFAEADVDLDDDRDADVDADRDADEAGVNGGDRMRFLTRDATKDELHQACVDNHLGWMRRIAEASSGEIFEEGGLLWIVTWSPTREVTVAVTDPTRADLRDRIDAIIAYCHAERVELLSFWAMHEADQAALDVWLGARGLRRGGRPHWMELDLRILPEPPLLDDLAAVIEMTVPDRFDDWTVPDLLCYHPDSWRTRQAMVQRRPQRVWHGVVWNDGRPTGQVSMYASDGELGVLGLHDLLVVPSARMRGPGLDRFQWITRFATDLGCRYLVANAAEEAAPLYRLMGFRTLGFGQTWWTPRHVLTTPPTDGQIAFAEALGESNLDALPAACEATAGMDAPLANSMTPLRFAAATQQQESARWLLAHGASPDLLAFWDLGWRDEARDLLDRDPAIAAALRPHSGKTLLHVAVERDDPELAQALLRAGTDPAVRDARFDATALEWTVELRRPRMAAVLRAHTREEET